MNSTMVLEGYGVQALGNDAMSQIDGGLGGWSEIASLVGGSAADTVAAFVKGVMDGWNHGR